tara:strand:- start:217 stop:609 length:393 start_codon:yes stop_codon:yes gene_type:complete
MYNTEHVCEYYKFTGRHTDEVLHELYQNDLLISFNQSEYNDQIMSEISKLYDLLKDKEDFNNLFKTVQSNLENSVSMFSNDVSDLECSLILLFSYDYFYLFHEVLRRFFKDENYSEQLETLSNCIENKNN